MSCSEAGKIGSEKSNIKNQERFKKFRENYISNPKICKFCNSVLSYKKRRLTFCNHSCAASFNNKGVRRHGEEPSNCLFCGKKLLFSNRKYCTIKCQKDFEWSLKKKAIESKGNAFLNPIFNSKVARRYLKETKGGKCTICGTTEWMGKEVPLVLDHIDGNSTNWSILNLRLICGNCDMQTSTYKGKNRGNGRFYRKLRYQSEKSY